MSKCSWAITFAYYLSLSEKWQLPQQRAVGAATPRKLHLQMSYVWLGWVFSVIFCAKGYLALLNQHNVCHLKSVLNSWLELHKNTLKAALASSRASFWVGRQAPQNGSSYCLNANVARTRNCLHPGLECGGFGANDTDDDLRAALGRLRVLIRKRWLHRVPWEPLCLSTRGGNT